MCEVYPPTYALTINAILGRSIVNLQITKEDLESARVAKDTVLSAIAAEEKFLILVENYRELELELLKQALDKMLFSQVTWTASMDKINAITRRLSNYLSTAKAYLDQVPHFLSAKFGKDSAEFIGFGKRCNEIYDSNMSYRIMEELRKFTQHRQFPIGSISLPMGRRSINNQEFIMHSVVPKIRYKDIADDEKFKPAVKEEIKKLGEMVDLKPLVDEYQQGLHTLHIFLREMLLPQWVSSSEIISRHIDTFNQGNASHFQDVDLVKFVGEDQIAEEVVNVRQEHVDRLKYLLQRVSKDMKFTEQFATSLGRGTIPGLESQ